MFNCSPAVYSKILMLDNLPGLVTYGSEFMKNNLPLPQEKKLTVLFRLEPGCLGPKGEELIDKFCQLAQKEFESLHSDFVQWDIVPRNDKSLPEMQYQINNKKLSQDKAAKFLHIFNKDLGEFENQVHKKLAAFIDQYLGH